MKNLLIRTITGILFVVIIIGAIHNPYTNLALFLIVAMLCVWEFNILFNKHNHKPYIVPGLILSLLIYSSLTINMYFDISYSQSLIIIPAFILFLGFSLLSKRDNTIISLCITLFGACYFTVPVILFALIPYSIDNIYSARLLLGFFILLWSYDTFAYLTGMLIGKHLLFKRISPKKTWEGFAGGIIFSLLSAYIISLFLDELIWIHWLILSVIISLFGTLGDLIASIIKRSVNAKDSGKIITGHGGVIDRFDSFMLAAPAAYLYIEILSSTA